MPPRRRVSLLCAGTRSLCLCSLSDRVPASIRCFWTQQGGESIPTEEKPRQAFTAGGRAEACTESVSRGPKEKGEGVRETDLGGDLDVTRVDRLDDVVGGATVDGAADRLGRAEDLLDAAGERSREGLLGVAHGAGNVDDGVEFNVARVLDVLLLLAVADGLLEGADDERRSGRDDRDGGLTVLDRELDRDAEALPVAGRLGDVLTDLLGRLF